MCCWAAPSTLCTTEGGRAERLAAHLRIGCLQPYTKSNTPHCCCRQASDDSMLLITHPKTYFGATAQAESSSKPVIQHFVSAARLTQQELLAKRTRQAVSYPAQGKAETKMHWYQAGRGHEQQHAARQHRFALLPANHNGATTHRLRNA